MTQEVGYYTGAITLDQVRAAKPTKIYYGVRTCWWTHNPLHLSKHQGTGLPCDPRGGVLFETDKVEEFLSAAEQSPGHYGRFGLQAFIAAHHLNCVIGKDNPRPWCFPSWDEYNRLIDEALAAMEGS